MFPGEDSRGEACKLTTAPSNRQLMDHLSRSKCDVVGRGLTGVGSKENGKRRFEDSKHRHFTFFYWKGKKRGQELAVEMGWQTLLCLG